MSCCSGIILPALSLALFGQPIPLCLCQPGNAFTLLPLHLQAIHWEAIRYVVLIHTQIITLLDTASTLNPVRRLTINHFSQL